MKNSKTSPVFFLILSIFLFHSNDLRAEKSVYSFGGSCVSQGSWTQAALQQTQTIAEAIEALASDPNCTGLQNTVVGLKELQNNLQTDPADAAKVERFESIPKNLDAIRSATNDPNIDPIALQEVAMNETIDGAGLAMSAVGNLAKSASIAASPEAAVAAIATTLGKRTKDVAARGLEILDRLATALPNYTKCAQNSANHGQLGTLLAATIQMAGAYSGSNSGMHSKVAETISKLVTLVQQQRFAQALNTLNTVQYQMSMSCLLETTAASYCNADDARKLLKLQVKEFGKIPKGEDSPFEGLYLLSRDIPNIAAWLKRVQFGFMPRLTSDADFKNKVVQNYNQLLMSYYSIRGKFSEDLSYYRSLPDLQSKQTVLFNMLQDIVNELGGGRRFRGDSNGGINFFTMVQIPEYIPFYLIGRKEIPAAVAANNEGRVQMPWDQWMKGQGAYENALEFKDPDHLVIVIEKNLDTLLDEASRRASIYLMNFLIVDNPNLVAETVADQNLTVIESFRRVYKFLDRLDKKILAEAKQLSDDPINGNFRTDLLAMRPAVAETSQKIKSLINALGKLMLHSARTAGELSLSSVDYQAQANQLYKDVITVAFTEFNVQFQRETMLAVRMGNFVRADFATKIRYREQMSSDERNMLVSYGREMIDKIIQNNGFNGDFINPQQIETDLDTAQTVNMRNLVAFEQVFKQQIYMAIQQLNKIVKVGASEVGYRNALQEYKEGMRKRTQPFEAIFPPMFYYWKWAPEVSAWEARRLNGFSYEMYFKDVFGADDLEGSIEKFKSRLCLQTLALQDKPYFKDICNGSEIKSIFDEIDPEHKLNASYNKLYRQFTKDDSLPLFHRIMGWGGQNNKDVNKVGPNVCVWRDYNRRNLVFWLTKKLRASEE